MIKVAELLTRSGFNHLNYTYILLLDQTDLSDGPLPLAAPALPAAFLSFLLLLGLGHLLHVR